MATTRYARGLAPSQTESLRDFLDTELLKVERAFDEVLENPEPSIANDASGAANQATVNAILAALRAKGIISP